MRVDELGQEFDLELSRSLALEESAGDTLPTR